MHTVTKLKHYYGGVVITMAGSISLAPRPGQSVFRLSGETEHLIQSKLAELKERWPFMYWHIREGVTECDIRLFSYDKNCADGASEFLDALQEWIYGLLKVLAEQDMCIVTVNMTGSLGVGKENRFFRILNRGLDVQYALTRIENRALSDRLLHSQWTRVAITAACVVLAVAYIVENLTAMAPILV